MGDFLKWLPLIPYLAAHPQAEQFVAQNLTEMQQAVNEFSIFWEGFQKRHGALIKKLEAELPDLTALANQIAPVIKQIESPPL